MGKVILFFLVFLALSLAGGLWTLRAQNVEGAQLARVFQSFWHSLSWGNGLLLLVGAIGLYGADAYRYQVFSEALGEKLGWKTALQTTVLNFFFSWLTPGAGLGAPAAAWALSTGRVPISKALVIAFGKSFTGSAFIIFASFLALAWGPSISSPRIHGALLAGACGFSLMMLCPILMALQPSWFKGWADKLRMKSPLVSRIFSVFEESVDLIRTLFRRSPRTTLFKVFISLFFYFALFAGTGVVILHAFGSQDLMLTWARATIFLALAYVSPTPGGAGLAEVAAVPLFGALCDTEKAFAAALIFRALTYYFQILIGALVLALTPGIGTRIQELARRVR